MKLRFASLLVIAAFALAPLAQAVDCVMHVPVQAHAAHGAHDSHTDHGKTSGGMAVADCFAAAMDGVLVEGAAGFSPLPALPVEAFVVAAPRPVVMPRMAVAARWRGPPDDVLMTNQRRRI